MNKDSRIIPAGAAEIGLLFVWHVNQGLRSSHVLNERQVGMLDVCGSLNSFEELVVSPYMNGRDAS